MRKLAICFALFIALAAPAFAEEQFKDVPKDHWAAKSVEMLAQAGIMKGYPDSSYKGDRPVTRYELAVALANFVQFIEKSRKPIETGKFTETSDAKQNPGETAIAFLKDGKYLPAESELLKGGNKPVTFSELSAALTAVAGKLIENDVPAQQTNDKKDAQDSKQPTVIKK